MCPDGKQCSLNIEQKHVKKTCKKKKIEPHKAIIWANWDFDFLTTKFEIITQSKNWLWSSNTRLAIKSSEEHFTGTTRK